jgi:mRNA interferase HigB
MHVLAGKHLKEAVARFPQAAKPIAAWRSIAKDKRWRTPEEVRETFADVEYAGDYVVFHIQQNKYRLLATLHYSRENDGRAAEGHLWVRSFLSNKQYEDPANWNKGVPR